MTTIAYRDGVMAADTRAFSGTSMPIGFKPKIFQHRDGSLIGISSNVPGLPERIREWFLDDKNPDLEPQLGHEDSISVIEVTREGAVFVYMDSIHPAGPLLAPYYAVGSGANYALGAMIRGANAREAVEAGMAFDPWSGGEVMTLLHRSFKMTDLHEVRDNGYAPC